MQRVSDKDKSGANGTSSVNAMLQDIKSQQSLLSNSVKVFNRLMREKSTEYRYDSEKRLKFDCPPGWVVTTMLKDRKPKIIEIAFEESTRRHVEKARQLARIRPLNIGDNERLSDFLNQHVVLPFQSQCCVKVDNKCVPLEIRGSTEEARKKIVEPLTSLLGNPVHLLPSVSFDGEKQHDFLGMVEDLLKTVKTHRLACTIVAIDGDQLKEEDDAYELYREIEKQFKEDKFKAIVLILNSGDCKLQDLESDLDFDCCWLDEQEDMKEITSSQKSQSDLVVKLNKLIREEGGNLLEEISRIGCAPGWHITTTQKKTKAQIAELRFDELNLFLNNIAPLKISNEQALSEFLNEQVVTPFKRQKSYKEYGLSENSTACVLSGSSVMTRNTIVTELSSTLRYPVFRLPMDCKVDEELEEQMTSDLMVKQLVKVVGRWEVRCCVVAIDVDKLEPGISVAELFSSINQQLCVINRWAIAMIMSSSDAALTGLPRNIERFTFNSHNKCGLTDKTQWYLLKEITKHCSSYKNFSDAGIDWKKVIKILANRVFRKVQPSTPVSEIEKTCNKVVQEYSSQLKEYCARHGLRQLTQDAAENCATAPVEKKVGLLSNRAEDFILPGQPELAEFFRKQVIELLEFPKFYEKYGISFPGSFLLYGLPGTGKTHALKKLAEFSNLSFFEMNPDSVGSSYVDECEKNIAEMFREAAEAGGAIIFIDEIDSMLPNRSGCRNYSIKRTNELLRHIEAAQDNRILVVGATNRLNALDPAAIRKGRLGEAFEVKALNADGISELLNASLRGVVCEDAPLNFNSAVQWLGDQCLVSNVYAFSKGLRTYAAREKTFPIDQKVLDRYLQSLEDKGTVKVKPVVKSRRRRVNNTRGRGLMR